MKRLKPPGGAAWAGPSAKTSTFIRAGKSLIKRNHGLAGALSLSIGMVGCSTPQTSASSSQVEVEASFRERLALAPGVRLEASLRDISRADAAADIVGKTVLEDVGQPPYRFTIDYDPAAIVASHRYAVRVVLMKDTRLLFTTDQVYPVLTGGSPASVQVLLKKVGGGQ